MSASNNTGRHTVPQTLLRELEAREDATIARIILDQVVPRLERLTSDVEHMREDVRTLKHADGDYRQRMTSLEQHTVERVRNTGVLSVGATIGAAIAGFLAQWLTGCV